MAPKKGSKKAGRKASKKTEVIEISSGSESSYGDLSGDEGPSAAAVQAKTPSPGGKRKVIPDSEDEPVTGEEPSLKRQKLPHRARGKTAAVNSRKSSTLEVATPSSASRRSRNDEIRDSEEGQEDQEDQPEDFKTPKERRHITFDDDDDNEEFVTPMEAPLKSRLEAAAAKAAEDEEDDSDDDASPEAVSSHVAQAQITKAKEAARKAAKEQDAALKRKRQDRDSVLRKQAKGAKERNPEKKAIEEGSAAAPAEDTQPEGRDQEDVEHRTVSRKRKLEVPDLLPPEFLESDDEEDASPAPKSSQVARPKKIRFTDLEKKLDREGRSAPDERVGSTVYRVVAEQGDRRLAPKMSKSTRNLKEHLLARNRVPQKKGGFWVKSRS